MIDRPHANPKEAGSLSLRDEMLIGTPRMQGIARHEE
ncbi:MAG: hypothetical protein AVDCRST_MAG76-2398 [uncultured Acidimicrobiales bacterium]|uniref:Uncharacterized protein n=1 Tax=uncultured Acidimicrobiales bacterium TaxID=310071 RepID=A0A6J4IIC3_9ACTN|nr:MAG: hypothetical protein AVDCRST_MAG76-2398 [uncultured Acidimicrobiales bacterium]